MTVESKYTTLNRKCNAFEEEFLSISSQKINYHTTSNDHPSKPNNSD
jgi:hypothetical protein